MNEYDTFYTSILFLDVMINLVFFVIPCMIIAYAKNRSILNAFASSLIFGIFALIYYIFVSHELPKEKRTILKCSSCGIKVTKEDKFCPECGAIFKEGVICKKCKTQNKENAKYCTKCGDKL